MPKTVAYAEVKVGDRIYNSLAYHHTAEWNKVTGIEVNGDRIGLITSVYTQWGHAREGIAIEG